MKFGIEYEICVKCPKPEKGTEWIDMLKQGYIDMLHTFYKHFNDDLKEWMNSFDNKIIVEDDDHIVYMYDISTGEEVKELESAILSKEHLTYLKETYKYPMLTIDGTVKCHYTTSASTFKDFCLNGETIDKETSWSINLEIVSQILHKEEEVDSFYNVFIEKFEKHNLFIKNKSQGIHLNVSLDGLDASEIKSIIDNYYNWEEIKGKKARPHGTTYAVALTEKNTTNLNKIFSDNTNMDTIKNELDKLLVKEKSIHYKKKYNILEFRIFSPISNFDVFQEIKTVLNYFKRPIAASGGAKTKTRRRKLKSKKTRKLKKARKTGKSKSAKESKMTGIPLFVYGSLLKGLPNNPKLDSATFGGEWKTKDMFYMIGTKSKVYPYVSKEKLHDDLSPTHIYGELYYVNDELLAALDVMEGHPTQYKRELVPIEKDAKTINAYMYILESKELKEGIQKGFSRRFVAVKDGDWLKYVTHS